MRVPEVSSLGAHKREETSRSMRRSGLSGVFIRGEPPVGVASPTGDIKKRQDSAPSRELRVWKTHAVAAVLRVCADNESLVETTFPSKYCVKLY
jgi:hypothetical protein